MERQLFNLVWVMFLNIGFITAQNPKGLVLKLIGNDSLVNAVLQSAPTDKSLFQKDTLIQKVEHMLESSKSLTLSLPLTTMGWDAYYFSGGQYTDSVFYNEASLFSSLNLSTNVNVFGLPLQIFGQASLRNLRIDPQLSDFSINFDQAAFLQRLKNKHQPSFSWNNFSTDGLDQYPFNRLNQDERQAFTNELKHRLYKAVLDNPKYLKQKQALQLKIDSAQQQLAHSNFVDSLADIYQQQIALFNQIEQGYRDTWDYKCLYNDQFLHQAKTKLNAVEQFNATWSDPQTWMNDSLQAEIRPVQKMLLYTRNLDFGQFSIPGSDFTLFQMPLQGIHTEIGGKHWFVELAQGRQRFQQGFAPSYGNLLFSPRPNKSFSYAKVGLGSHDGNYVHLALMRATTSNKQPDSLSFLRQSNLVWELSGRVKLNKQLGLELTGALSEVNSAANETTSSLSRTMDQLAWKANLVFISPKKGNKLGIGYFFTGSSFITFGNPFLFNNWRGLNADARLVLLNKNLVLNGVLKYGQVADEAIQGGTSSELQFFGEITTKLGKTSTLSLSFLPNLFKQSSGLEQNLSGSQNIYQLQFNHFASLGTLGDQLLTSFSLSNFRFNYQLLDTLNTEEGLYSTCQESLIWSNGNVFTGLFTCSKKGNQWLEDWLGQIEFNRQFRNWNFKTGLQALRQFGFQRDKWGISLGFQTNPKARLGFDFTCIYRKPFSGDEADQILGNFRTYFTF